MAPAKLKRPALAMLGVLGLTTLLFAFAGLVGDLGQRSIVLGIVGVFLMSLFPFVITIVASWYLPHQPVRWPDLIPGAIVVTLGVLVLHVITVYWIAREVESKTDTYGAIGAALALLLWAYLLGRLITASAVINASLWQRREDRAERRAARARMHRASPGPEGPPGLHSGGSTRVRAEHCCRAGREPMVEPSRGVEPTTEPDAAVRPKLPRWRRILVGVLVVLVCLLVPISVVGVWVRNTILHTDQFVDTLAPLADDPAVDQAIAARVTNTLIEATDLEAQIADRLPDRAKAAAPFIAGGAETVVRDATLRIVESDRFDSLWESMLRRAHTQVVAVLQGEGTDNITTKNGQVVVRLGPVVDRVAKALSNTGISFFDDIDATRVNRQIVLFQSEDLRKGQGAVDLLDKVANYLPFVALVLPRDRAVALRVIVGARSCGPRSASRWGWRCCSRSSTSVARSISIRCRPACGRMRRAPSTTRCSRSCAPRCAPRSWWRSWWPSRRGSRAPDVWRRACAARCGASRRATT